MVVEATKMNTVTTAARSATMAMLTWSWAAGRRRQIRLAPAARTGHRFGEEDVRAEGGTDGGQPAREGWPPGGRPPLEEARNRGGAELRAPPRRPPAPLPRAEPPPSRVGASSARRAAVDLIGERKGQRSRGPREGGREGDGRESVKTGIADEDASVALDDKSGTKMTRSRKLEDENGRFRS